MLKTIRKIKRWYYTRRFLKRYLNTKAYFKTSEYANLYYTIKRDFEKCDKNKVLTLAARMPYMQFLNTPYWFAVRNRMLRLREYKCEVCSSTNYLQIHHTSYANRGKEIIYIGDLQVLCESCHKKIHNIK